ncbi:hypothetical protein JQC67_00855 [Aurantibacter crassamenti]|uniref:hypothetical protein n=1 Tax=Aurantibacter crassamenti TaxID=1837375 RepID=UPI00193A8681|nr:hypothetical protein [Aurantibacter crassamenti]MBM1104674.1 hypothetical protein [Aurantibacter crassamenti]
MKKQLKSPLKIGFMAFMLTLFMVGCSSDDGSVFDTGNTGGGDDGDGEEQTEEVATIIYDEATPTNNMVTASASGEVGTAVPGRVIFTSDATSQRRMYITQNISGQGDMPFNNFNLNDTDLTKVLKADGSIDLDGSNKKEIDFTFNLPVPDVDNGTIVYSFWTTTGKGDFRDPTKRLALGVGTITVTVGTGTNPTAEVREITGVKLFAPAEDGTTKTFFSLLDENVYQINEGPEFRAFWDFGYYYKDNQASFASTSTYNVSFGFPVEGLVPDSEEDDAENETLNEAYFKTSTMVAADFDAVLLSGALDVIVTSEAQSISALAVDDVIEFVDNYGKKGLIKITEIEAGFNTNDYIVFDVKIQP